MILGRRSHLEKICWALPAELPDANDEKGSPVTVEVEEVCKVEYLTLILMS